MTYSTRKCIKCGKPSHNGIFADIGLCSDCIYNTTSTGEPDREWEEVIFSADCDEDGNCPHCGIDYSECPCPGPTQDGYEYVELRGTLYARRVDE